MTEQSTNSDSRRPGKRGARRSRAAGTPTETARLDRQSVAAGHLLDHIPEAILLLDRDGHIRHFNPAARSMFGELTAGLELEGWPATLGLYQADAFTPFPAPQLPPLRAMRGEAVPGEEMLLRRNGAAAGGVWISMSAGPLTDANGAVDGAIVRARDISERRQAEVNRDRYNQRIEALYRLTRLIVASNNEISRITAAVARLTAEVLGDHSTITLLNVDKQQISISAFHDTDPEAAAVFQSIVAQINEFSREQGLVAQALRSGQPLLIPSISAAELQAVASPIFAEYIERFGVQSILIAPMHGRGGTIGTINLSRYAGRGSYDETDQSFLMEIAYRTALAIEDCVLIDSLRMEMTARLSTKEALDVSEARFRSIFQSTTVGIKILDPVGTILQTNPALQQILGYSEGEIIGRNFHDFIHPQDVRQALAHFNALKTGVQTHFRFEHRLLRKDGSLVWVKTAFTSVYTEHPGSDPALMVGVVEDISAQKQTQLEMAELQSRLHNSIELERLRVARELHDGPMQDLYSVFYRLEELRGQSGVQLGQRLETINRDLQSVIQDLRVTAKELRPPAISNFGLEKAIRSHVEDLKEQHPGIKIHLNLAQDRQRLPEDMRLALFRVCQQALANVVRHSAATEVQVEFTFDSAAAQLEITDNGRGFDVPPNWLNFVREGHFGLAGAAERMHAVGGTLSVQSQPAQFTSIRAAVPLQDAAEGPADEQEPMLKRARDLI
jgi:PAS domain S-box-containing protein